jgi:hypothetical protein
MAQGIRIKQTKLCRMWCRMQRTICIELPANVPNSNGFPSSHRLALTPNLTTPSQPPAQDTSERIPSLPVFTPTPFFPLSPSLTSFNLRTPTIKLSSLSTAHSCTPSLTIVLLHFTNNFLTIFFFHFFYTLKLCYHVHPLAPDIAPGISVGTAYVFEVSLLLVKEGHCIRVRSASPFVSHLLCDSHSSPHRFYTLHPSW